MKPDETAVYDLCMELSTGHALSDATFWRAHAIFSEQQIVDLVALSDTYATVAMLLKSAADEGVPNGRFLFLNRCPRAKVPVEEGPFHRVMSCSASTSMFRR